MQELAASSGAMLAELVPSLRAKVRGTTLGSNATSNGRRESLFKAVFEVLVASQGAKPMLVVLDDLQWADEATALLLRDLAERLGNSKIVVIGTYWETDLDPERPFTGVGARLLRRRRAQRIALGTLTDAEVEQMLLSLADGTLTAVQLVGIQAATEGNPLFVEHSYLYMAESEGLLGGVRARSQASYTEEDLELAQSVRGLIGRRLERLSEPAHRMLTAAAVLGRAFAVALFEAFRALAGGEPGR